MNQKQKIKSFAVWKTAKIGAIVSTVVWALAVWPMLVPMTLSHIRHTFHTVHPHDFRTTFILFAIFPLGYGMFAFIVVALVVWLYNVLSPRFGGIEIEVTVDPDSN